MAFQDTAGGIVLDATLTDIGRKYMAQGRFKVTKFALGDDEIDYGLVVDNAGTKEIPTTVLEAYPILEAPTDSSTAITHGLIDMGGREDVRYLPQYRLVSSNVPNAVQQYGNVIYLSVNDETTTKLATALDIGDHVLENEEFVGNMLIAEAGVMSGSVMWGDEYSQQRYIDNLDLYDQYVFVYGDSRLFDKILVNRADAVYENDKADNLYETFQPLIESTKISLPSLVKEQDTYYCRAIRNRVYDIGTVRNFIADAVVRGATPLDETDTTAFYEIVEAFGSDSGSKRTQYSNIYGPRSNIVALNFVVNTKLNSKSNAAADLRYTKFGKTSVNLFGDGNLYDYIDTQLTIEGCMTARQFQTTMRIIRFSGT